MTVQWLVVQALIKSLTTLTILHLTGQAHNIISQTAQINIYVKSNIYLQARPILT